MASSHLSNQAVTFLVVNPRDSRYFVVAICAICSEVGGMLVYSISIHSLIVMVSMRVTCLLYATVSRIYCFSSLTTFCSSLYCCHRNWYCLKAFSKCTRSVAVRSANVVALL